MRGLQALQTQQQALVANFVGNLPANVHACRKNSFIYVFAPYSLRRSPVGCVMPGASFPSLADGLTCWWSHKAHEPCGMTKCRDVCSTKDGNDQNIQLLSISSRSIVFYFAFFGLRSHWSIFFHFHYDLRLNAEILLRHTVTYSRLSGEMHVHGLLRLVAMHAL